MSVQARTTQLREHNCFFDSFPANPIMTFEKHVPHEMRIDSWAGGGESFGAGHCFIVFKKAFIHGKKVEIQWNGFDNLGAGTYPYHIELVDGAYDRASMTDFPDGTARINKGAGSLHFHAKEANFGAWTDEIYDFTADTSGATEDYVTLFVTLNDAWIGKIMFLHIDYVKILDGATTIFENDFDDDPNMEVTGTFNDYGTVGGVYQPEIFHMEALHLKSSMQSPMDVGGYFILGFWMRKMRPRLDKIKADDHNIPRAILRLARDIIEERLF